MNSPRWFAPSPTFPSRVSSFATSRPCSPMLKACPRSSAGLRRSPVRLTPTSSLASKPGPVALARTYEALAHALGLGFVPIRKPGKLPGKTVGIDYVLEYGTDRLELHEGQIGQGTRVLLVDDLIATGGTALAAAQLLREQGATLLLALFAIDLPDLGGRSALEADGVATAALLKFPGN